MAAQEDVFFMDFNGSHKYNATPAQVYNTLLNPDALKASIPGAEEVKIENQTVTAAIHVNALGVNATFHGSAQIVSASPPAQIVLGIDRSGSYGTLKGQATINLAADGAGTNLTYTAHFDLSGRIGLADNPIGQQVTKGGLNTFFKNLEGQIK